MSGPTSLLQCERLVKTFGGKDIFSNLSLRLGPGAYALQGANGIGKSTLLGILSGSQVPDSGDVWIDGYSLRDAPIQARRRLSFVPDESPIYPFMTGENLLAFVASAKNWKVDAGTLERMNDFGLCPYRDTTFEAMSLGTQKKFLLLAAWMAGPQVLLLDEPSEGLDLAARQLLEDLVKKTSERSVVFFSSHDIDFIERSGASVIRMESMFGDNG